MNKSEQLIACLEGEIAKRDSVIIGLRKIAIRERMFRIEEIYSSPEISDSISNLDNEIDKLYAAPAPEAKAQGVIDFVFSGELPNATFVEVEDGNGNSINVGEWLKRDDGYSVLRLNAVPVQQVSAERKEAPIQRTLNGWGIVRQSDKAISIVYGSTYVTFSYEESDRRMPWLVEFLVAMLAAAPAAPAADAGLVEALKQAFPLFDEDGLNELYHHCEIAVLGDRKRLHKLLATHSAKGVV